MSQEDPTDLGAEAARDEAKATKHRNLHETEKDDLAWLMSSPRGRRVVWRFLEATGLHVSSFTGSSETFFREGKRAVGLDIQGKVAKAAPQDFHQMMQEHFGHD